MFGTRDTTLLTVFHVGYTLIHLGFDAFEERHVNIYGVGPWAKFAVVFYAEESEVRRRIF